MASGPTTTNVTEIPITTKWDGGDQRLQCFEYRAGTSAFAVATPGSRRVIKCVFDGYHGSWLPDDNGEELTWWFFSQFLS